MEFLQKLLSQGKEIFGKLSAPKKIIIGSVVGIVVIAFVVLFSVSRESPSEILFTKLSSNDFAIVTQKLDELGYGYTTNGTTTIKVNPEDKDLIMTKLAQEQVLPKGIPGWELFDVSDWTETDKERKVKAMRALRGEVKRHIEALKNIERADVEIAMPDEELFKEKDSKYTAAVSLSYAPGYDGLSKKEIKGIVFLVSRAVGNKLPQENVTITDDHGNIISDFDDAAVLESNNLKLMKKKKELEEEWRVDYLRDITKALHVIYGEDRVQIMRLSMEFNWDKIVEKINEVKPVVMIEDNPNTPYSELKVQDYLQVSSKKTEEHFKGHGFNPEGPAGTEPTTPPGYKGADDQFAIYDRIENISNNEFNKIVKDIKRDDIDLDKVTVSVVIDGIQDLPKKEDGTYDLDPSKEPVRVEVTSEELKKVENSIKGAIGYDQTRGDQVTVENIMFDRSDDWAKIRDAHQREERRKQLVLAALIGVFALFLGFILFTAIRKEMARRRRIREEQLALEQQRMREAALRAAEEEGVDVELSLEEKARLELQENAINLAKERPDDVAALLRTWLAEE